MTKLTTHALDIYSGKPAKGMKVDVYFVSEKREKIKSVVLNKDGRPDEVLVDTIKTGSYELVFGAKIAAKNKPDAIICLGSVIQGETKHFDFVCNAVAMGIKDLNISLDIPVIFGVLTDNTMDQAKNRSGGKYGNKGIEAAITAIKMAVLNRK